MEMRWWKNWRQDMFLAAFRSRSNQVKTSGFYSVPVYIHQKEIKPYEEVHRFPLAIKVDKKHFPLTLIGYNRDQKMVFTQLVGDLDVDVLIADVFEQKGEVEFLHARNVEAGCFICRIERA